MVNRIKSDLLLAQKTQDAVKLRTLRMLLADIKNKEIEFRPLNRTLTDADVISLVQKGIKSRAEAVEMFKKGSRDDLVKKEEDEIAVLKTYLPEMMGKDEVKSIVNKVIAETGATTVAQMGIVMAELKVKLAGKADMSVVGKMVREALR